MLNQIKQVSGALSGAAHSGNSGGGARAGIGSALSAIAGLAGQKPNVISHLLLKYDVNAAPTPRLLGNFIKINPAFYAELKRMADGGDSFSGPSEVERITVADKLANAGLVFSNVIRETQRRPEPYNKQVPAYYEPTGNYNVQTFPQGPYGGGYGQYGNQGMMFGGNRKVMWIIGGLIALFLLYEFSKHK